MTPHIEERIGALRKRCKSLCLNYFARVAELADARDSKSRARKGVPVQLRALVPQMRQGLVAKSCKSFFVAICANMS